MNQKKISSIILAFLIISNTIPQSIALGAEANTSKIAASSQSTADTTAPVATFNNIIDNSYYSKAQDPEIDVTKYSKIDNANSYFEVTQDRGKPSKYYFDKTDNVKSNPTPAKSDTESYTLSKVISADAKYNITVHIQDVADSTLSSEITTTFFVDTTPATTSVTGITNTNIEYGTNLPGPVTPTISIVDKFLDTSDIGVGAGKHISVTLSKNGSVVAYPLTYNKTDDTLTLTGSSPLGTALEDNGSYDLIVSVSTKSNPAVVEADAKFVIDNASPTISYSDANRTDIHAGGYYNGEINPVLNFADTYIDINNVLKYNVTLNGAPYEGTVVDDGKGNIKFSGDPITKDGSYNIVATATDEAGNTNTYTTTFILDNSKPNIDISGVDNNEYTNAMSVTPKIKVTGSNIDLSKTTFSLTKNGKNISVSPTLNGDVYSFDLSDEGSYSLTATSVDKSGNSFTSDPIDFTIDRTSPILDVNYADGSYFNHGFKPSITIKDPDAFINKLLINGISYDINNIPEFLENIAYELIVQAEDKAGNLSALKILHFTIDTIAPVLNVQNLLDNFYYNKTIEPSITSTDVNLETFTMTLNGKPYNNEAINAEGNYELVITSIDKAGNVSKRVINFIVDKTAATITIVGVINNTTFTSILSPLISINDPNADVTILLDGQDYHGGPITTDGKHTLIITTVDEAGNISTKVITFFLKATKPVIYVKDVENGSSYDHSVTPVISFSKDVVADDTIMTLDGTPYKQGDAVSSTGDHELDITVDDSAGNKVTKKIRFTIVSTSVLAAIVPKALHKILPAKITNSKQNLSIVLASILAILVGGFGIALLKLKSVNKKIIKKSDDKK